MLIISFLYFLTAKALLFLVITGLRAAEIPQSLAYYEISATQSEGMSPPDYQGETFS